MSLLTEAREHIATSLADLPGVYVYPHPVEAPALPCVMVSPATVTWFRPTLQGGAEVSLDVRVAVGTSGGNARALEALEALVWAVAARMPPSDVGSPRVETIAQSECYILDLTTSVTVIEEEATP